MHGAQRPFRFIVDQFTIGPIACSLQDVLEKLVSRGIDFAESGETYCRDTSLRHQLPARVLTLWRDCFTGTHECEPHSRSDTHVHGRNCWPRDRKLRQATASLEARSEPRGPHDCSRSALHRTPRKFGVSVSGTLALRTPNAVVKTQRILR